MADVYEFLTIFGELSRLVIFYHGIIEKMQKYRSHMFFFSAFTLAVSLGSSLTPRPGGLGFKQLPQATANVYARKTCMVINIQY